MLRVWQHETKHILVCKTKTQMFMNLLQHRNCGKNSQLAPRDQHNDFMNLTYIVRWYMYMYMFRIFLMNCSFYKVITTSLWIIHESINYNKSILVYSKWIFLGPDEIALTWKFFDLRFKNKENVLHIALQLRWFYVPFMQGWLYHHILITNNTKEFAKIYEVMNLEM